MGVSKRVSAPRRSNSIGIPYESSDEDEDLSCEARITTQTTPFVPFLSHLTQGCSVDDVNPSSCVPLFLSRGYSENAVQRLKMILNGDAKHSSSGIGLTGMISGPPSSVAVPLVADLQYLVHNHLKKKYDNNEDIEEAKKEHNIWYGIIDGCHLNCAIVELKEDFPLKWGNFMWKIFVLKPGYSIDEYRKLSVVQNERNKQDYHYDTTLFDLLSNLRVSTIIYSVSVPRTAGTAGRVW